MRCFSSSGLFCAKAAKLINRTARKVNVEGVLMEFGGLAGMESKGPAITAETDGGDQEARRDGQADPKARAAEEFQWIELRESIDHRHVRVFRIMHDDEPFLETARQTTDEHANEKGGIERELLNRADCEPR